MSNSPTDGAAVPRQPPLGPKVAVTGADVCWPPRCPWDGGHSAPAPTPPRATDAEPPSTFAPPALVEAASRERGIGETLTTPGGDRCLPA